MGQERLWPSIGDLSGGGRRSWLEVENTFEVSTTALLLCFGRGTPNVPRGTSTEEGARAEIGDQDDRLQLSRE